MRSKRVMYILGAMLFLAALTGNAVFAQEEENSEIETRVLEVVENGKTYTFEVVTRDGKTLINGKKFEDLDENERKVYERVKSMHSGQTMIIEMLDSDGERRVTVDAVEGRENEKPTVWTTENDEEMEVEVNGETVIVRKKRSGVKDSDEVFTVPGRVIRRSMVVSEGNEEDGETTYEIRVDADNDSNEKEIEVKVIDGEVFINGQPAAEYEGDVEIRKDTGNRFFFREGAGGNEAKIRIFESEAMPSPGGHFFAFPPGDNEMDFEVEMPRRYSTWIQRGEDGELEADETVRTFGRMMGAPHPGMRMEELDFGGEGLNAFYSFSDNPEHAFFMMRDGVDREIMGMEREVQNIVRKLREAEGNDRNALEAELDAKLEEIFDKKQSLRQDRLNDMMENIQAEREAIQKRKDAKEDIINRRKQELMGKSDPLRW